jgi:hypothetical protein
VPRRRVFGVHRLHLFARPHKHNLDQLLDAAARRAQLRRARVGVPVRELNGANVEALDRAATPAAALCSSRSTLFCKFIAAPFRAAAQISIDFRDPVEARFGQKRRIKAEHAGD